MFAKENLKKARFVSEVLCVPAARYEQGNSERLSPADYGTFPLTLFLGLLYHLENPMLCLRNVCALTEEVCLIETQVIDEIEGRAEWGSRGWWRPYSGVLALIDETSEHFSDNDGKPDRRQRRFPPVRARFGALEVMLLHVPGFSARRVFLKCRRTATSNWLRGKRVMCAAWK